MIRTALYFAIPIACLAAFGCGEQGPQRRVVRGEVLFKNEPVPIGTIRFIPIDGTIGPVSVGNIEQGAFIIDTRGGVPLGRHRIEVKGEKPTGKFTESDGIGRVEETVPLVPPRFGGEQSPLTAEVLPRENEPLVVRIE